MYKKYKKYTATKWEKIEEKRHAKDPNHFRYARLKIYAPEESDLHELH